jgi:hypothetical protein
MVRAILAGRKTQTRRLASSPLARVQPGDRMWVRETWALTGDCAAMTAAAIKGFHEPSLTLRQNLIFAASANGYDDAVQHWRPSIHMPRWASRITLHVEAVRVERLQDISEGDAMAEGAPPATEPPTAAALITAVGRGAVFMPHRSAFANLWNSLHGPRAWSQNPWVVVLTFAVRPGAAGLLREAAADVVREAHRAGVKSARSAARTGKAGAISREEKARADALREAEARSAALHRIADYLDRIIAAPPPGPAP